MFHQEFYTLNEVSTQLSITMEAVWDNISNKNIKAVLMNPNYTIHLAQEREPCPLDNQIPRYIGAREVVPHLVLGEFDSQDLNGFYGIKVMHEDGRTYDFKNPFDLVWFVSHEELNRLKSLKAQQDGKPPLEQVQAENEALKKQLDELNNSTTKGKQQLRELILSGWIAGKGLDTAKRMKQSDVHEELKRVHGLFQIAESTFKDFWQAQKLIKLDTGKR